MEIKIENVLEANNMQSFLPEEVETPQLVQISHSSNLVKMECVAAKGGSCTWK